MWHAPRRLWSWLILDVGQNPRAPCFIPYPAMIARFLILVCLVSASAFAIEPADLYGTWRLVSYTRTIVATGERSDVYGPSPMGYLSYGPDGRMFATLGDPSRPKPSDLAKVTDEERLKLYRTFSAYAGTFTLKGSTVTHHVDISMNQTWTGTDLVRNVAIEGDTLIIRLDPQPNQVDGQMWTSELKWVKVKAGQQSRTK